MGRKEEYIGLREEISYMPDKEFFGRNLYPLMDYIDMLEGECSALRKSVERARAEALDTYEKPLKDAHSRIEELEIAFTVLRCGLTSAMFIAQVGISEKDLRALDEVDKTCRASLTNAFIVSINK